MGVEEKRIDAIALQRRLDRDKKVSDIEASVKLQRAWFDELFKNIPTCRFIEGEDGKCSVSMTVDGKKQAEPIFKAVRMVLDRLLLSYDQDEDSQPVLPATLSSVFSIPR